MNRSMTIPTKGHVPHEDSDQSWLCTLGVAKDPDHQVDAKVDQCLCQPHRTFWLFRAVAKIDIYSGTLILI